MLRAMRTAAALSVGGRFDSRPGGMFSVLRSTRPPATADPTAATGAPALPAPTRPPPPAVRLPTLASLASPGAGVAVGMVVADCAICFERLLGALPGRASARAAVAQLPQCGHCFHRNCIREWLHRNSCPVCRATIRPSSASSLRSPPFLPPGGGGGSPAGSVLAGRVGRPLFAAPERRAPIGTELLELEPQLAPSPGSLLADDGAAASPRRWRIM